MSPIVFIIIVAIIQRNICFYHSRGVLRLHLDVNNIVYIPVIYLFSLIFFYYDLTKSLITYFHPFTEPFNFKACGMEKWGGIILPYYFWRHWEAIIAVPDILKNINLILQIFIENLWVFDASKNKFFETCSVNEEMINNNPPSFQAVYKGYIFFSKSHHPNSNCTKRLARKFQCI